MGQITLRASDEILKKVQKLAKQENLTVTDYLLSKGVPDYMNNILTIDKVKDKMSLVSKGDTFSLKTLYSKSEWEAFTTGSRISTGRLFYKAYKENLYNLQSKVKFLKKNSANLALYEKLTDN